MQPGPVHDRHNPLKTKLLKREWLTHPNSLKKTAHLVVEVPSLHYKPGDTLAVFAENSDELVQKTIDALNLSPQTPIFDKRGQDTCSLYELLKKRRSITKVPKKLFPEQSREWTEERHLWDALEDDKTASFSIEELESALMPLLPRFYSISSSSKKHPEEAHLTVTLAEYESAGKKRYGVASHYLLKELQEQDSFLSVYIHPSKDFFLPQEHHKDIIMVGPGTGIASFRAFIQERILLDAPGKNWLFFGEWTSAHEFYYRRELEEYVQSHKLILTTAFSREQEEKIYVQHRMLEKSKELWEWLEKGAHFYVSGDAKRMAKDVDEALHLLITKESKVSSDAASAYVKKLKEDKRYLRDVY